MPNLITLLGSFCRSFRIPMGWTSDSRIPAVATPRREISYHGRARQDKDRPVTYKDSKAAGRPQ